MDLDHGLDEREPEARPLLPPAQRRFRLDEGLHHAVDILFGDADSAVAHGNDASFQVQTRGDLDHASGGRELDRIVHEVEQHLFQLALVAPDQGQIGRYADLEVDAGIAGPWAQETFDRLRDLLDVDIALEQRELAGFGFGEVENVVDDVEQVAAARMDVGDVAAILLVGETALVPHHQFGEADDRVQRRAQLVADLGQELDLDPACLLRRVLGMSQELDTAVGDTPHLALLEAVLDRGHENADALGFVDELAALAHVRPPGHGDADQIGACIEKLTRQVGARGPLSFDVAEHDRRVEGLQRLEHLVRRRNRRLEPMRPQVLGKRRRTDAVGVDDQHARRVHGCAILHATPAFRLRLPCAFAGKLPRPRYRPERVL